MHFWFTIQNPMEKELNLRKLWTRIEHKLLITVNEKCVVVNFPVKLAPRSGRDNVKFILETVTKLSFGLSSFSVVLLTV